MGILTSDMTRLCMEIGALRGARKSLMKDLARETKEMKHAVSTMQAGFRRAHAEMAGNAKAERAAFISSLRSMVCGMRKEFVEDLAGARQAWFGPVQVERVVMAPEERVMAEVEAAVGMEEIEAPPLEEEVRPEAVEEEVRVEAVEEEIEEEEKKEELARPVKPKPTGKRKK
jgi:hypothetical protein